jgi:Holliday junction DNA helicase RuvA
VIAQLRGRLLRKDTQDAVVDVGGVGYHLTIPVSTFYRLGDPGTEVTLLTHTHVREDALALFGALRSGDVARLTRIPGVGKKTAERLVVELKDKMAGLEGVESAPEGPAGGPKEDLVSALLHLGYSRPEAERGVEKALKQGDAPFEDLLRRTLRVLSGR